LSVDGSDIFLDGNLTHSMVSAAGLSALLADRISDDKAVTVS